MAKMNQMEFNRMFAIKQMCCLINNGDCKGVTEVHHLTDGGRRLGHMHTIPLCQFHHTQGHDSYHQSKKSFMARYGNNDELLRKTNELLEAYENSI